MHPQDIKSLQILEEIDNSHSPSQRDLARRLDMSLGLVNSFIKRLARKGYLKVTTIPRNRVKYILTPMGFAEKSRLTYEFIQYSFHFYKRALGNFQSLLNELERKGVKHLVFYGANDLAEIAFISLKATDIKLVGIVDDLRQGEKFLDFTVKSTGELSTLEFDRIIITTVDSKQAIYNKLREKRIPDQRIIMLEQQIADREQRQGKPGRRRVL
jgi:DNA-binding MarR family transcriptional regulator